MAAFRDRPTSRRTGASGTKTRLWRGSVKSMAAVAGVGISRPDRNQPTPETNSASRSNSAGVRVFDGMHVSACTSKTISGLAPAQTEARPLCHPPTSDEGHPSMPTPKPFQPGPPPSRRKQVETSICSHVTIMRHSHFARGLDDIREGRPFDYDVDDNYWAYEKGRLFGAIAPRSMPLFDGKRLNPKAVRLFIAASERSLIP